MPASTLLRYVHMIAVAFALPLWAATYTVTNTNDSGPGSLRQAMLDAGAGDRIEFAIGSGPQFIQPLSKLPEVNGGVTIDGMTQPGYSGVPLIEIDGALVTGNFLSASGLDIAGHVRGLAIGNFVGPAINLRGGSVRACHLGTDRTGTIARRNAYGVLASSGTITIGGAGEGNLISANSTGVRVLSGVAQVSIQGNTFGSDRAQTVRLGNTTYHVFVENRTAGNASIGGGEAANVFVGASVAIETFSSSNVSIHGNYIGVTPAGRTIPNQTGVSIYQSHDVAVTNNTIRGNLLGIVVSGNSLRNTITANSMLQNGFGIDLSGGSSFNRVTPNDAGDGDTGPNNFLNFPILGRAKLLAGETVLDGTLSTFPNRTHRIDLYASSVCNSSGYGEGRDHLGSFEVTTDGSGIAAFTRNLPSLAPGTVITATSTSTMEGTSEFSPCISVEGAGVFSFDAATLMVHESGSASVLIRRLQGAAGAVSVSYSVTGGTATAGTDFTGGSGTLSFADGETSKTVTIPLVNDTMFDPDETIVLALSNPTNGAVLGSPATTTVTIRDDDAPPTITVSNLSVVEGNSGRSVAQVRLTLSSPVGAAYTVSYHTSSWTAQPGSDYVHINGTVTFLPGQTVQHAPVEIIGDTTYEQNEVFEVYLPSGGWTRGTVTIVNDDPRPSVAVRDVSVTEGSGRSTVQVTFVASAPVTGTVHYALLPQTAQAGSDFVAASGLVSFSHQTSRTIPVTILGDTEPEPNETFRVSAVLAWGDFDVVSGPDTGVFTILNDDVGVGPAERSVAVGATGTFTVQLGDTHAQDITLALSSDPPGAVSVPSTLVIRAGTSAQEFEVRALAPNRTATIRVAFPSSLGGATHDVRVHTYTKATLRFTPTHVQIPAGQTANVSVSVDPPNAITIGLMATGPVTVPSSLTIPAGGTATFTVTASSRIGAFTIDAHLPVEHGSEVQPLFGDVVTPPTTPSIVRITPSHGPATGGTAVNVEGMNLRAECTLRFGGVPATSVRFGSTTSMSAVTPPHARGSVDVHLVCGGDVFTLRNGFGYVAETPRAAEVRPSSGTVGGGTHVRVTGENFDGSCWLFFGNSAAAQVVFRDAGTLTGVAPPRATPGAVDVTVRCSGGTFAAPAAFEYRMTDDPAPHLDVVDPSAASPGELVTIRGLHFRPQDGVAFGATPAAIIDSLPNAHVVRVPELPAGRVSVLVTDTRGRTTTSGPVFSVLEARPPRITGVAPASVAAGGELDLQGEGFRAGYTFEIGGRAAAIVTSDYTRAVVRVAADVAPGAHAIQVRNSAGVLAAVGPTVTIVSGGPTVSSVDPRCATTDGGIFATVRGTGFTATSTVAFDGVAATEVLLVDPTSLRVRVPAGSAGPARVSVSDGTRTSTLTNGFTYDSPFAPRDSCTGRMRSARH